MTSRTKYRVRGRLHADIEHDIRQTFWRITTDHPNPRTIDLDEILEPIDGKRVCITIEEIA